MATDEHILNKQIHDYLKPHWLDNRDLGDLFFQSVGRVLFKIGMKGGDWRAKITDQQMSHIADWLYSAWTNDEPWIHNRDCLNRSKKLMKFSTIEQVVKEADKAMFKANQRLGAVSIAEGDEVLADTLSNGFYVARLLTPQALDRESVRMQHCIGHGSYDKRLKENDFYFYSFRDRHGKPHATMTVAGTLIEELQGKQNSPVIYKYRKYIYEFLCKHKLSPGKFFNPINVGYVIDTGGVWHPVEAIPDNIEISHDVILHGSDDFIWSKNLKVRGKFDASYSKLTRLPENLSVSRGIDLMHSSIEELPDGLRVNGDLDLSSSKIKSLPRGLVVAGNLNISRTGITEIPDDLIVIKDFIAEGITLNLLPSSILVHGSIALSGTKIEKLPDYFKVHKDLDLTGTSIKKLPRGLVVEGNLNLANTKISVIPEDLRVNQTLTIKNSNIISLPKQHTGVRNLRVGPETSYESLCGVTIRGNLDLSDNYIKLDSLPPNLRVDGTMYLWYRKNAIKLPENYDGASAIDLSGARCYESLPANLKVNCLFIANTGIKKLPKGLRVSGRLHVHEKQFSRIPPNIGNRDLKVSSAHSKYEDPYK